MKSSFFIGEYPRQACPERTATLPESASSNDVPLQEDLRDLSGRGPGLRWEPAPTPAAASAVESVAPVPAPLEAARIAVYDGAGSAPRVEEVSPVDTAEYIALLTARTYDLAKALGGHVPFSVISEIVENYIHADFRGPVVTILDSGNTIRFSDRGPGIKDKVRALEPGYTTATADMKRFIRAVGSGLPLARECLSFHQGCLEVDDNLDAGAVVTVSVSPHSTPSSVESSHGNEVLGVVANAAIACSGIPDVPRPLPARPPVDRAEPSPPPESMSASAPLSLFTPPLRLTNRQKQVLALVMETGSAGPSLVARELAIGLSTSYRDLAHLETLGMIVADETGKRSITEQGASYLTSLLNA